MIYNTMATIRKMDEKKAQKFVADMQKFLEEEKSNNAGAFISLEWGTTADIFEALATEENDYHLHSLWNATDYHNGERPLYVMLYSEGKPNGVKGFRKVLDQVFGEGKFDLRYTTSSEDNTYFESNDELFKNSYIVSENFRMPRTLDEKVFAEMLRKKGYAGEDVEQLIESASKDKGRTFSWTKVKMVEED